MGRTLPFCLFLASAIASSVWAQTYTPSPADWARQSIYFLVLDRFANGDPTNDDLGHGEFNPEDADFYHGGDLKGLIEKLD